MGRAGGGRALQAVLLHVAVHAEQAVACGWRRRPLLYALTSAPHAASPIGEGLLARWRRPTGLGARSTGSAMPRADKPAESLTCLTYRARACCHAAHRAAACESARRSRAAEAPPCALLRRALAPAAWGGAGAATPLGFGLLGFEPLGFRAADSGGALGRVPRGRDRRLPGGGAAARAGCGPAGFIGCGYRVSGYQGV